MTQAFNLALLGNNVNTSGQLNADTGIYNTVNVANGGNNLTTIPARSILVANALDTYVALSPTAGQSIRINAINTAWEGFIPGTVTSVATSGGVTGGTITGSGTVSLDTNNTFGIGSTNMFWLTQGTSYTAGSTVSGSYLFYITSVGGAYDGWTYGPTIRNDQLPLNITTTYSFSPGGGVTVTYTPVGGTWRVLGFAPRNFSSGCSTYSYPVMCIRVS